MTNIDYQNRALEYQSQALGLLEYQKRQGKCFYDRVFDIPSFINLQRDEVRGLEEGRKQKEEAYEMFRKILQWLSPGDFEETHGMHFKRRFGNTGQWLLDDSRFRSWSDEAQCGLLWCHGARKSYLVMGILYCINLYWYSGLRKNCISVRCYKSTY